MSLKYVAIAAALILATGIALLIITAPPTADGPSPLANAKGLAPPVPAMFAGKLGPVPELVNRQRIKANAGRWMTPHALDVVEDTVAPFRIAQSKGPSGLWDLSIFYNAISNNIDRAGARQEEKAWFDKSFAEWEASGRSSPAPYIIKGFMLKAWALTAIQSAETSETATPEFIQEAHQRLRDLISYLEQSKPKADSDPEWYALMITSLGLRCTDRSKNFDRIWSVLEEGSGKFPDYYQMYFEAILAGFRCGGPTDVFAKTIDIGSERTNAVDGKGIYARSIWLATQALGGEELLTSDFVDWPQMKQGMKDVLRRYPDAWNTNYFAKFACVARDAEMARELLPKALELPVLDAWGDEDQFRACWNWAMSAAADNAASTSAPVR